MGEVDAAVSVGGPAAWRRGATRQSGRGDALPLRHAPPPRVAEVDQFEAAVGNSFSQIRPAYDRWLAAKMDELRAEPCWRGALAPRGSGARSASPPPRRGASLRPRRNGRRHRPKTIDECVEDTAELLDACIGFGGGGGHAASRRRVVLGVQVLERRCGAEVVKCGSNLCKRTRTMLYRRSPSARWVRR